MEEMTMEGKVCASKSDESWSGIAPGRSSDDGTTYRRKKKFSAPNCDCGAYAILFQSSTSANPNRLFFGCSKFKTTTPHCEYFAWLDEYVDAFPVYEAVQTTQDADSIRKLEEKMVFLEKQFAEGKKEKEVA
ncbi:hypothetical protein PIB30_013834 [Stylosanthes scabra]|uniref:GRF-type domain-containing protein n=1 Tax=Stylosanthes scabra TaxID=79078 RepID=A0ABU6T673_9FABA|nr:hypothetical protein [Stylosanthes scabra]